MNLYSPLARENSARLLPMLSRRRSARGLFPLHRRGWFPRVRPERRGAFGVSVEHNLPQKYSEGSNE